jgi:hypothetical protein
MRWARASGSKYHLIVLPLHGRGNKGGEGQGVRVFAYEMPSDPLNQPWKLSLVDESMHMTHNLDVVSDGNSDIIYIGGKEGIKKFTYAKNQWTSLNAGPLIKGKGFGEVRVTDDRDLIAGVEPMHGNELTVYTARNGREVTAENQVRTVLTADLNQGHALAVGDLMDVGSTQVVAGWREPNQEGKVGVKIFVKEAGNQQQWQSFWIDDNGMACEDLQVLDLNDDGKADIIASGRATKNLKIYWNKTQ